MKVEQIDIEKIKPYIYNPRKNLNVIQDTRRQRFLN